MREELEVSVLPDRCRGRGGWPLAADVCTGPHNSQDHHGESPVDQSTSQPVITVRIIIITWPRRKICARTHSCSKHKCNRLDILFYCCPFVDNRDKHCFDNSLFNRSSVRFVLTEPLTEGWQLFELVTTIMGTSTQDAARRGASRISPPSYRWARWVVL